MSWIFPITAFFSVKSSGIPFTKGQYCVALMSALLLDLTRVWTNNREYFAAKPKWCQFNDIYLSNARTEGYT